MKRVKNIIFIFLLTTTLLIGSLVIKENDIKAVGGGVGSTIAQTFPDENMAQAVADTISKGEGVGYVITQSDITNVTTFNDGFNGKNIKSIEGIQYFINLQTLSLKDNSITSLPSNFSNLVDLTYLSLENNKLTVCPNSFNSLINLEILRLSDNKLTSLPNNLSILTKLERLHFSNNQVSSLDNVDFSAFTKFIEFYADGNKLSSLPNSIGDIEIVNYDFTNQRITLKAVNYAKPLILKNPIKGFGNDPEIKFSNISNGGKQKQNNIVWDNLTNKNQTLTFDFEQDLYLDNFYPDKMESKSGSSTEPLSGSVTIKIKAISTVKDETSITNLPKTGTNINNIITMIVITLISGSSLLLYKRELN